MSERNDPYSAYNFLVEIDGLAAGAFTEVTGLGVKVEPIQYREGGDRQSVRQLPGQTEYSPVTLRYGLTQSHELWDWLMAAVQAMSVLDTVITSSPAPTPQASSPSSMAP